MYVVQLRCGMLWKLTRALTFLVSYPLRATGRGRNQERVNDCIEQMLDYTHKCVEKYWLVSK